MNITYKTTETKHQYWFEHEDEKYHYNVFRDNLGKIVYWTIENLNGREICNSNSLKLFTWITDLFAAVSNFEQELMERLDNMD